MSIQTVEPQKQTTARLTPIEPPPLQAGDRLSRVEFERRYHLHPEIKKAELIEGVVYVPSPIRTKQHGDPHFNVIGWLAHYQAKTPGVRGSDNATVLLDFENEVQPDILLRLESEIGGLSKVNENDYLEGPPELIIEIAASSAAYDLHDKKRVYARNGVPEYLVVQMYEQRIDWFVLREGVYEALPADEKNILHSEVFPGLWLNAVAFWDRDLSQMLATLQEGLDSLAHEEFLKKRIYSADMSF